MASTTTPRIGIFTDGYRWLLDLTQAVDADELRAIAGDRFDISRVNLPFGALTPAGTVIAYVQRLNPSHIVYVREFALTDDPVLARYKCKTCGSFNILTRCLRGTPATHPVERIVPVH